LPTIIIIRQRSIIQQRANVAKFWRSHFNSVIPILCNAILYIINTQAIVVDVLMLMTDHRCNSVVWTS